MTMPTLSAICAAIQDVVGAVTGIRSAPDTPPEQMSGGVTSIVYPAAGRFTEITAGQESGEHTLHLMLATPRSDLRTNWSRMIGLGDTVARALLAAGTLNGTVLNLNLSYTFGGLDQAWSEQPMFGWLFEISVLTAGSLS